MEEQTEYLNQNYKSEIEYQVCPRCKGSGDKWYEPLYSCNLCDGKGKIIIKETKVL